MKVYFVRHAQSKQNITEQYQLESDPLSEVGKDQAKVLANRFKNIKVGIIISSDSNRAMQTAGAIAEITGNKIETSALFKERKRPSEFTGRKYFEPDMVKIKQIISQKSDDPNWRHSDEETMTEIIQRAKNCISMLESRKEESVVVVSHSAFIKCVIACMMFEDKIIPSLVEDLYSFFITGNAGITLCEKKINRDINIEKWHLVTWNDQAHLGELK